MLILCGIAFVYLFFFQVIFISEVNEEIIIFQLFLVVLFFLFFIFYRNISKNENKNKLSANTDNEINLNVFFSIISKKLLATLYILHSFIKTEYPLLLLSLLKNKKSGYIF